MLIQHGLGDPRGVCNVVHGCRVVALGSEDLAGSIEKLDAPLVPWQTGSPATDLLLLQLGGHKFTLTLRFVGQRWRIRGEQVARQVSVLGDSGEDLMRGKPEIIGPAYAT